MENALVSIIAGKEDYTLGIRRVQASEQMQTESIDSIANRQTGGVTYPIRLAHRVQSYMVRIHRIGTNQIYQPNLKFYVTIIPQTCQETKRLNSGKWI